MIFPAKAYRHRRHEAIGFPSLALRCSARRRVSNGDDLNISVFYQLMPSAHCAGFAKKNKQAARDTGGSHGHPQLPPTDQSRRQSVLLTLHTFADSMGTERPSPLEWFSRILLLWNPLTTGPPWFLMAEPTSNPPPKAGSAVELPFAQQVRTAFFNPSLWTMKEIEAHFDHLPRPRYFSDQIRPSHFFSRQNPPGFPSFHHLPSLVHRDEGARAGCQPGTTTRPWLHRCSISALGTGPGCLPNYRIAYRGPGLNIFSRPKIITRRCIILDTFFVKTRDGSAGNRGEKGSSL